MTAADRLDRWERRLDVQTRLAPYALLLVALGLYWLTGDDPTGHRITTVGVAGVTAVWLWAGERIAWRGVYVAGLIVLIAVLSSRGMWFASFFGFTGFLHSWRCLTGAWRVVGVAATALISVTAYWGGPPDLAPRPILTFVLFVGAITGLVAMFSLLGDVVAERSAERKRTVDRLEEALRENAGLHAQLLVQAREAGVLDERQRIAAEIHDTLAQGLTGIIAQLQAATDDDWRSRADTSVRLARSGLAEARRTVSAVGPEPLSVAPLHEALKAVAVQWAEVSGVRADVTATGTVRDLHPEIEAACLRIAQEALANVGRHADASRVGLTLSYLDDTLVLDVRDDGVGFDPDRVDGAGYGLTSMRGRAVRLSGTLDVESRPGDGTAISAALPAVPGKDTP